MKRLCWIAVWGMLAYALGVLAVNIGTRAVTELLAGVTMPAWVSQHIGLTAEITRGLLPYLALSVVVCLGLGAHLPGTQRSKTAPDR